MSYFTIPGTGLVLEPAKIGGLACWKDLNKTAWWEASRRTAQMTSWGTERFQWHNIEAGVTDIYFDDDGFLTRRQMEAASSKSGFTFDDGSTLHQIGEDELTRYRVADLVQCEIVTETIDGENFLDTI